MDFIFLWPWCSLLILLPFFVYWFQKPLDRTISQQALCVPFFQTVSEKMHHNISFSNHFSCFLFCLAFLFLILAGMRPISFKETMYTPSASRQLMMVLDVSGSMAERDFVINNQAKTRLEAVKTLAHTFLEDRLGDAIGLTIFGTEPYLYIPLTQDIKTAQRMLNEVDIAIAGERTAIGDALLIALKQMKDIPSEKKVILLFSDGFANAGIIHPEEALKKAKEMGVKIYTVGLGSDSMQLQSFFFTQEINPSADLDEKLLKKIATETNGKYFRVKTTQDLKKLYTEIDKIEPIQKNNQLTRPKIELFWLPLFFCLIFFALGYFLREENK